VFLYWRVEDGRTLRLWSAGQLLAPQDFNDY
jgi:hypothetical protein